MFKNQPEAIKQQERFLHMKKILNTEFKKHEMGPRQATLQQKALSSDAMLQQLSALPPRFFPS